MNAKKRNTIIGIGIFSVLWILSSSIYTVGEVQQALIIRFGAPVDVIRNAGLRFKIPLIDYVTYYDTRILTLEPSAEQVILGDQKRLEVQTYTRYKISNPLRFFQSLRTTEQAETQLNQLVSSSLRRELGKVTLHSLLSDERPLIMERVQREVAEKTKSLGIEITEVRFHRADLPLETSQAIYDRMKSERQREAKELRAQGFEWAQQIQSNAEKERTIIISEAQSKAKIEKGKADAKANQTLSEAFKKDPQFYKLYRSLQTYRQALADTGATIVLSPDTEFLRYFKLGPNATVK